MKKYQVAIIGTNIGAKHFEDFQKVSDRFNVHTLCGLTRDAIDKIKMSLHKPHGNQGKISDWNDGTIDRMIDIMQGNGEEWLRSGNRYRDYVAESKY